MLKVLLLDELLPDEILKTEEFLVSNAVKSPLDGLYWLKLPKEILTDDQLKFTELGDALKIAIEVSQKWIKIELLIKSEHLDNRGGGQLNKIQFEYVSAFYEKMADFAGGGAQC
jgi:hypothetical protein